MRPARPKRGNFGWQRDCSKHRVELSRPSRPSRLPKERRFNDLLVDCISALKIYLAEAEKLCEMIWRCRGDPSNVTEQMDLMAQRDRESEAHADYIRVRKRLLHAAGLSACGYAPYRRVSWPCFLIRGNPIKKQPAECLLDGHSE